MDSALALAVVGLVISLILAIVLGAGIYLLKQALRDSASRVTKEVRDAREEISDAIRNLQEEVHTERAIETERHKIDESQREIARMHHTESTVEHQKMLSLMERIAARLDKIE